MKNTLKPLLIILALVALGALVYVFFIQQEEPASLTRNSQDQGATRAAVGVTTGVDVAEFQTLLQELNAISLNKNVFAMPQYPTLLDHTETALIKLEATRLTAPAGKEDPFESLGRTPTIQLQGSGVSRESNRLR